MTGPGRGAAAGQAGEPAGALDSGSKAKAKGVPGPAGGPVSPARRPTGPAGRSADSAGKSAEPAGSSAGPAGKPAGNDKPTRVPPGSNPGLKPDSVPDPNPDNEEGAQPLAALAAVSAAERTIAGQLAAASGAAALVNLKLEVAGKRGPLQPLLASLKGLAQSQRKALGAALQQARMRLTEQLGALEAKAKDAADEAVRRQGQIDLSLPGRWLAPGSPHPLRLVEERVLAILQGLGFQVAEGPLIEHDWFNFEALNIPPDHPAREMQDTFFLSPELVLRTHTSNAQIRTMIAREPPLAIVAPGMVFRRDEVDASHTPVFHQIEGLWLSADASLVELKGVLEAMLGQLFGPASKLRYRPSYFPFTEPSTEVDVSCSACVGKRGQVSASCRLCRGTGWLEIMGAGMVDPAVLEAVGHDPERVQGFAFGMGIERLAILMYGIDDIRALYDNDARFLANFAPACEPLQLLADDRPAPEGASPAAVHSGADAP